MATKPNDKEYYLDKPENVQRLLNVFYVICELLLAGDLIVQRHT